MNIAAISDPVLVRLKDELTKLYGPRLKQVLLYGSRARGDHREDSDYDVLVVLEPPLDYSTEQNRLSALSSQLLWDTVGQEYPADVYFRPVTRDDIQDRTGFMHNVRNDAIELTGNTSSPTPGFRIGVQTLAQQEGTMSPEAVDYLAKADRFLSRAQRGLEADLYEGSARDAYISALNAARAIVFDRTAVAVKTHRGTRSELFHLIEHGLKFDAKLADFLRDAFETKQRVDYEPVPENVSREKAADFVRRATAFITAAKAVIENRQ